MAQQIKPKIKRNQRVYKLWKSGRKQKNIASQFHISKSRISQIIKKLKGGEK